MPFEVNSTPLHAIAHTLIESIDKKSLNSSDTPVVNGLEDTNLYTAAVSAYAISRAAKNAARSRARWQRRRRQQLLAALVGNVRARFMRKGA